MLPVTSFKDPAWNLVGKELWPVVAKSIGTDRLAQQVRFCILLIEAASKIFV